MKYWNFAIYPMKGQTGMEMEHNRKRRRYKKQTPINHRIHHDEEGFNCSKSAWLLYHIGNNSKPYPIEKRLRGRE